MSGEGVLTLTDAKGRRVIVPVAKLAYVEIGHGVAGQVGFRELTLDQRARSERMISALLWAVIGGTVIGLLGKLVAPGDSDNVPLWLTILCGIGGVPARRLPLRAVLRPADARASTGGATPGRSRVAGVLVVDRRPALTGRRRASR